MKSNQKRVVLIFMLVLITAISCVCIALKNNNTAKASGNNQTTIYYQGFSNPYIHYKIGNGEWTKAPGVAMTKTDELNGNFYKITLELGSETEVTACFNNGNGSWDNNNTRDYRFGVGSYSCYGGNIYNLSVSDDFEVSSFRANPENTTFINNTNNVYVEATALGGTAPYEYEFGVEINGATTITRTYGSSNNYGWKPASVGTFSLFVHVRDANGKIATKTIENFTVTDEEIPTVNIKGIYTDLQAPQCAGTAIKLYMKANGETSYRDSLVEFVIEKDGESETLCGNYETYFDAKTVSWTPATAGTYTITAKLKDGNGATDSMTTTYEVCDSSARFITIYYQEGDMNRIHYKVSDGYWTEVPGVIMKQHSGYVEGYGYEFKIYVGNGGSLTACFNDGNGTWDNNNGQNYVLKSSGIYFIKNNTVYNEPTR